MSQMTVGEAMSAEVLYCFGDDSVEKAATLMNERHVCTSTGGPGPQHAGSDWADFPACESCTSLSAEQIFTKIKELLFDILDHGVARFVENPCEIGN
ncbi:hypothetical protein [Cupriavidus lacunae]|uniref:hypothetical protein n=1 Tax=Cupriavidus lacunae TaxID=2666307 RepID=UPI0010589368|nr:hypothetical protein [Cupriavidus lacunae]